MNDPVTVRLQQNGLLLPVLAQAGSRREGIVGTHDGRLKVAVTQVAERGKANRELARVLAKGLGLRKSQVQLASGATNPRKEFLISGVEETELLERISEAVRNG